MVRECEKGGVRHPCSHHEQLTDHKSQSLGSKPQNLRKILDSSCGLRVEMNLNGGVNGGR